MDLVLSPNYCWLPANHPESALRFQALAAQLDFLAWRDAQLLAISEQVEEAYPDLLAALTARVNEAGRLNLIRSTFALRVAAEETIKGWSREQLEKACGRAEAELDRTLLELPGGLNIESDVREQVLKAAPAIAGVGLIVGSVAAIPTVISFATVSTSVLAIWSTAAISWPLFALGAAGIGLAAFTGSKSLQVAEKKARERLQKRMHREAARQVFGIGAKTGDRCVLNDIQAVVVQAGQNRILGVHS